MMRMRRHLIGLTVLQLTSLILLLLLVVSYGALTSERLHVVFAPNKVKVLLPELASVPLSETQVDEPEISATTGVAIDVRTGSVLYAKEPDVELPPASSIKLLTAITARELFSPSEIATVGAYQIADSNQRLRTGMSASVEEMLFLLLVGSNNTAAYTLAHHDPLGYEHFIKQMNALAKRLHLDKTVANNPAGFDDEMSRTTARDLSRLLRLTLLDPLLQQMVSQTEHSVQLTEGGVVWDIQNTNQLLGVDERVVAGKTGTTDDAGQVLVSLLSIEGHTIVLVVMGSEDRYADTRLLADWLEQRYTWMQPEIGTL